MSALGRRSLDRQGSSDGSFSVGVAIVWCSVGCAAAVVGCMLASGSSSSSTLLVLLAMGVAAIAFWSLPSSLGDVICAFSLLPAIAAKVSVAICSSSSLSLELGLSDNGGGGSSSTGVLLWARSGGNGSFL